MGLVRFGGVLCLLAVVFGSICMTIVATMGDGEDPPRIFEQMGGASCGLFGLGLLISFVGWMISLNQPEPPKPTVAAAIAKKESASDDLQDTPTPEDAVPAEEMKPDPYASDHRRREP